MEGMHYYPYTAGGSTFGRMKNIAVVLSKSRFYFRHVERRNN